MPHPLPPPPPPPPPPRPSCWSKRGATCWSSKCTSELLEELKSTTRSKSRSRSPVPSKLNNKSPKKRKVSQSPRVNRSRSKSLSRLVPTGHRISSYISLKISERQEATAYSGKHISKDLKDFYWEEFKKKYVWNPLEEEAIKGCWWQIVKSKYTKNVHEWRHFKNGKLDCVSQDIWEHWQQYWSYPEWKDKARKAKENRLSEPGGPDTGVVKHTCGSRSIVEHSMKMAEELQRPPNSWEIFKKMHTRKDGTFVDARSKQVNDRMEELMATSSQTSDDGSSPIGIDTLYLEAVGGEKKRHVYGLGSQAAAFYPNSFQSTGNSYALQVAASIAQMRELSERQLEMIRRQEEMDRRQEELNRKIAELDAKTKCLDQMEEQMSRLI